MPVSTSSSPTPRSVASGSSSALTIWTRHGRLCRPELRRRRRSLSAGDGADLDHAALVRADADRALALLDLDVEAQLAAVDHLAELGVDRAGLALGRGRDVLDADLEADRRLALLQILEGEDRGVALDHADHSRRGEHARADGAAHIGEQHALDHELVRPLDARLQHQRFASSASLPGATRITPSPARPRRPGSLR